jgi:hypothetical protein
VRLLLFESTAGKHSEPGIHGKEMAPAIEEKQTEDLNQQKS